MLVRFSFHCIDRASQRLLEPWLRECPDRKPGLVTWLGGHVAEHLRTRTIPGTGERMILETPLAWFAGSVQRTHGDGIAFVVATVTEGRPCKQSGVGTRAPRECPICRETDCDCPQSIWSRTMLPEE